MDHAIAERLERSRKELLDLTGRNRLINTSRSNSRSSRLEIVDERSQEVFRHLVTESKAMRFLAKPGDDDDNDDSEFLAQPDDDVNDEGVSARHIDDQLQTALTSKALQKRLLTTFYDAATFEEEQGVNTLYLALGFLKWFEAESSDRARYAPLILIPVKLDRKSANARFTLSWTEEDINTNLSLQEKMYLEFGLRIPDVPDEDELVANDYFQQVQQAVVDQPRWEVLADDMVLWFYSFSKFLMYKDLEPDSWPDHRPIQEHTLIHGLLEGGFGNETPLCGDTDNIDDFIQPADMTHVMDADSSQAVAIEEVRQGRNLVLQGPPGTGKSQTITNLIATAVKEGKRVLFVAEKMAALEVVKRRLDTIGLGDLCLELHSSKSNKREVLEELNRTLQLGRPRTANIQSNMADLLTHRDQLNRHVAIMHTAIEPAQVTPYQAIGKLVRLRADQVAPADFRLANSLMWNAGQVRERENLLQDLIVHLREVGVPQQHSWQGVMMEAILPTDGNRILTQVANITERLQRLLKIANDLAPQLDYGHVTSPLDLSTLAKFGKQLTACPALDTAAIAHSVWNDRRSDIDTLLQAGHTAAAIAEQLSGTVADIGWTTDVDAARRDIAAHGASWLRIFSGDYRKAQATLRGILAGAPPKPVSERVQILDALREGQQARKLLEQQDELGRQAFGDQWRGLDSDWQALTGIATWEHECQAANLPTHFREVRGRLDDLEPVTVAIRKIAKDLKPMLEEVNTLFGQLSLDVKAAFDVKDTRLVSLSKLQRRLTAWQTDIESLTKWIAYYTQWRKLPDLGLGELGDKIADGGVPGDRLLDHFQIAYYEDVMRAAFRKYPQLAEFDGLSHNQLLARFLECDQERLSLTRNEVAAIHYQGLPTTASDRGEIGIVRKEIKKKRRHMPVRKLLSKAGHAIQAIKPVFMMSPISIAQYLEPGMLEFDLLLIDEASQVEPVDALGAMARVKQVVVVGDDKQMPPTNFFGRVVGDDDPDAEDDDDFQTGDLESILGLCEAQGMSQRMLQWHYRSRHESLIAVSNHEFYEDRLFVVPSPGSDGGRLGLKFHHVRNGQYARGAARNNLIEAGAVADAVMQHARQFPDKSLGIGAFSSAQRDAILYEVELRRRKAPDLEPFFAAAGAEPFFVKNLENIQGDERDVIFISVGYARDSSGYMAMAFGPLSKEGGERRLNVLITRAKERCEVFSSITADDLDLGRGRSRGAAVLKQFLTYAEKGFLDAGEVTDRGFDSEFEIEVARALTDAGYQVESQIGVAGFYVDLAIVDPDKPGRYLLGIECDGASYHSSRSARDRDRIRQQVLEDRGWVIHRIWSTDWFHRPQEQVRKVAASLAQAKAAWSARDQGAVQAAPTVPSTSEIERDEVEVDAVGHAEEVTTVPYKEAHFSISSTQDLHEVTPQQLAAVVVKIVRIEGPIHQDEVARRTATLWGKKRAGGRIADCVEAALGEAAALGQVQQDGLFFSPPDQTVVPIRDRTDVNAINLRKAEYLPPVEIRAALRAIVQRHFGIDVEDALIEASRLFGIKSMRAQLKAVMSDQLQDLLKRHEIELRNERLYAEKEKPAVIG